MSEARQGGIKKAADERSETRRHYCIHGSSSAAPARARRIRGDGRLPILTKEEILAEKNDSPENGAETSGEAKLSGRAVTIEQRKRAQAKRLASNLRANLLRRKAQARSRKADE